MQGFLRGDHIFPAIQLFNQVNILKFKLKVKANMSIILHNHYGHCPKIFAFITKNTSNVKKVITRIFQDKVILKRVGGRIIMVKKILVFVSIAMVLVHTGCVSVDTITDDITQSVDIDVENRLEAINGTYTLSPPDRVSISVNDNPDLNTAAIIRPDGNISFPLLGDVYIEGLTPLEVREKTHKLLGRYLKELPLEAVNVTVTGFNSKRVYIYSLGSGIVPIPFTGDLTVLRAVAQSGMLSSSNKRKGIKIMRPISGTNEKPQKRVIDLDDLIKRGEIIDNIVLRPNDIVYIPPTVMGRVGYALQNLINPARRVGSAYANYQYSAFGFGGTGTGTGTGTGSGNNFRSGF